LITLIHLLIFIILTFLLIIFPYTTITKNKGSIFIRNFAFSKQDNFLKLQKVVPNLIYLMSVFEYLFKNNFGVHFLWTTGFISWIVGCYLWVLNVEFSLVFISISIIFCLVALFDSFKTDLNEFLNLKKDDLGISVYILIIICSVLTMVIFNSLAVGITSSILFLLFFYDWKIYDKSK